MNTVTHQMMWGLGGHRKVLGFYYQCDMRGNKNTVHTVGLATGGTGVEEEQDPLYVQKMTVAALQKWDGHEGKNGGRSMN